MFSMANSPNADRYLRVMSWQFNSPYSTKTKSQGGVNIYGLAIF